MKRRTKALIGGTTLGLVGASMGRVAAVPFRRIISGSAKVQMRAAAKHGGPLTDEGLKAMLRSGFKYGLRVQKLPGIKRRMLGGAILGGSVGAGLGSAAARPWKGDD